MRMREFLIFLVIFTICYIIFCIIISKFLNNLSDKKAKKQALSMINLEQFTKFANFYGINVTTSTDIIINIFIELRTANNCTISERAKYYGISSVEFVLIVLYLEYLGLIVKKCISFELDIVKFLNFQEQNIIQKYYIYLQDKKSLDEIIKTMGQNALYDLIMMNNNYLMPGVRLIDSKLYYVGDYL